MTDNIDSVEAACAELARQHQPITFTIVAENTSISRTTLYRNPQLRAIIDEHRSHTHDRRTEVPPLDRSPHLGGNHVCDG